MPELYKDRQDKDRQILERRFTELSRNAYQREIPTYTDFLNTCEQNILHTLPKDSLYSRYLSFGGYEMAERQMVAFIPDALYLRYGKNDILPEDITFPFEALKISPVNRKFAECLTHRDYLGALLNLGIDRSKTGDILSYEGDAIAFIHQDIATYVTDELTRVKHTTVHIETIPVSTLSYTPDYEELHGTVASVRLDSLLPIAFSSSRSRLSGLIEEGKVYVNGRLVTNNGHPLKEGDVISVRGMGKFRFVGTGGKTKKNRISVILYKYV